MMKNIMYAAIICAALAVIYRQFRPLPTETTTAAPTATVETEAAKRKEVERRLKLSELQQEYSTLYKQKTDIERHLERDKNRLFRRIRQDSLLIYGARLGEINERLAAIEVQLAKTTKPGTGPRQSGVGYATESQ